MTKLADALLEGNLDSGVRRMWRRIKYHALPKAAQVLFGDPPSEVLVMRPMSDGYVAFAFEDPNVDEVFGWAVVDMKMAVTRQHPRAVEMQDTSSMDEAKRKCEAYVSAGMQHPGPPLPE